MVAIPVLCKQVGCIIIVSRYIRVRIPRGVLHCSSEDRLLRYQLASAVIVTRFGTLETTSNLLAQDATGMATAIVRSKAVRCRGNPYYACAKLDLARGKVESMSKNVFGMIRPSRNLAGIN